MLASTSWIAHAFSTFLLTGITHLHTTLLIDHLRRSNTAKADLAQTGRGPGVMAAPGEALLRSAISRRRRSSVPSYFKSPSGTPNRERVIGYRSGCGALPTTPPSPRPGEPRRALFVPAGAALLAGAPAWGAGEQEILGFVCMLPRLWDKLHAGSESCSTRGIFQHGRTFLRRKKGRACVSFGFQQAAAAQQCLSTRFSFNSDSAYALILTSLLFYCDTDG
jgi:hypothetical protein